MEKLITLGMLIGIAPFINKNTFEGVYIQKGALIGWWALN